MAVAAPVVSTELPAAAIEEVVADVVGLNDVAVGTIDDAIEDVLTGFDEVAALAERVTERRLSLTAGTLARVAALSRALDAAFLSVEAAEGCVAAATASVDSYAGRLTQLEAAWAVRSGEAPPQGAAAVFGGLFGFARGAGQASTAAAAGGAGGLTSAAPPPPEWDASRCRLNATVLRGMMDGAAGKARGAVAEADEIEDGGAEGGAGEEEAEAEEAAAAPGRPEAGATCDGDDADEAGATGEGDGAEEADGAVGSGAADAAAAGEEEEKEGGGGDDEA